MMMATGAFGPPSGAASVPWRAPEGPAMLRRVSAADTLVVAARMMASIDAASFMTRRPMIPMVFYPWKATPERSGATARGRWGWPPSASARKCGTLPQKRARSWRCSSMGGLGMLVRALIVTATALAAMSVTATSTTHAQVVDFSKYPDFSGQWKRPDGVGIQWDQSKPLGKQQAPLTPEYQARYEANLADQALGGQGDDKTGQCIPHGMPRVMTVVYPMEIIIMPKTTYILTDYTVPRRIFTDGRD